MGGFSGTPSPEVVKQAVQLKEKLHIPLIEYKIEERPIEIAAIIKAVVEKLSKEQGFKINPVDVVSLIKDAIKEIIVKEKIKTYEPDVDRIAIAKIIKETVESLIEEKGIKIDTKNLTQYIPKIENVDIAKVVKDTLDNLIKNNAVKIEPTTKYDVKTEKTIKYETIVETKTVKDVKFEDETVKRAVFVDEKIQVFAFDFKCPHCGKIFTLGGRKKE